MSDDVHVALASRLRDAHRRVAALERNDDEKARLVRRLIALTDASKRDTGRTSVRLDALLADLDAARPPVAGWLDEQL